MAKLCLNLVNLVKTLNKPNFASMVYRICAGGGCPLQALQALHANQALNAGFGGLVGHVAKPDSFKPSQGRMARKACKSLQSQPDLPALSPCFPLFHVDNLR